MAPHYNSKDVERVHRQSPESTGKENQSQCLKKLESNRALALMVATLWPTQAWWPQLLSLLIATPVNLPQHKDLLTLPHNGMEHPLKTRHVCYQGVLSNTRNFTISYQPVLGLLERGHQKTVRCVHQKMDQVLC